MSFDTLPRNRFLREFDLTDPDMAKFKEEFDHYYVERWGGTPHAWGAKDPDSIVTHWSREWEYPWAVLQSQIRVLDKVLDCGCGGSPLLPYLVEKFWCRGYGIDVNYGKGLGKKTDVLADLRHFYVDPSTIVKDLVVEKQDMTDIKYEADFFDKVFCISVIEHMKEAAAKKSVEEMTRVLKPGGKLIITMDHSSYKGHVAPWCEGNFKQIIEWSGLQLHGDSDFTVPEDDEVHGKYHVVGFVLK